MTFALSAISKDHLSVAALVFHRNDSGASNILSMKAKTPGKWRIHKSFEISYTRTSRTKARDMG